jgi:integrase
MPRPVPDTIVRNGVYHFKKRIPRRLVGAPGFGGNPFVQFSLNTKDRKVALQRAEEARQAFEAKVTQPLIGTTPSSTAGGYAAYVARIAPTNDMMIGAAERYRWDTINAHPVHHDAENNQKWGHLTSEEIVAGRPLGDWREERDQLLSNPITENTIRIARSQVEQQGWELPFGSDEFRRFCNLLGRARLSAIKTILEADTMDGFELLLGSVPKREFQSAYSIGQAVQDYQSKKAEKAEMVKKLPIALRAWNELIGIQPVSQIRKADVFKFRDRLFKVPERAGDRFKGMTFAQAIEANLKRDEPFPTLSARTVKVGYVGMLNAAVGEAVRNDLVTSNPFSNVRVEGSDEINAERRPFRDYELKAIFTHPIWTGCKSEETRNTPGDVVIKDHYYWPPLIALFSGMRGSEVGGLTLADVFLPGDHDLPHFRVRGTKTASAVREIPLHPQLLKLGFSEYVRELRKTRHTRLFPNWKLPAGKKKYSMSPCQNNFNKKVLAPDRIGGATGLTFHCFRHTLELEMSKATFDEAFRLRIMGHKNVGTKRNYRKPDLAAYYKPFCALKFEGVDLRHLRSAGRARV